MNAGLCLSESFITTELFDKHTEMAVESLDKRARNMDNFWMRNVGLSPLDSRDSLLSIDSEICQMFHEIEETELIKEDPYLSFGDDFCKPDNAPLSCFYSMPTQTSKTTKKKNKQDKKHTATYKNVSLPASFQPSAYSVIVGKGKEAKDTVGNRRLRVLASTYLPKYAEAANDKKKKSKIVSAVVESMQEACPVGSFIRLGSDGRWCCVSESVAREKVGYTFRELLGEKYKSSSKAKVAMRSQQNKSRKPPSSKIDQQ